ncbi:hypothetical protein BDV09DRAFT_161950 [Aspergillus tetrazonus]
MTRGNQRDRDRERQRKKAESEKKANTLSGTAFARKKEEDAAKMRAKQAAGKLSSDVLQGCFFVLSSLAPMPLGVFILLRCSSVPIGEDLDCGS